MAAPLLNVRPTHVALEGALVGVQAAVPQQRPRAAEAAPAQLARVVLAGC